MKVTVHNLYREKVQQTQLDLTDSGGFIPYGNYNNFPLRLNKLIDESPIATACLSTVSDFIEGEGFSIADLEDLIVNPRGETLADIHSRVTQSMAFMEGFALLIKYNKTGQIVQIYDLPFENCRLGKPDDTGFVNKILYNPYWGTAQYKSTDTIVYDSFNPNAVLGQIGKQGAKFKGQVLYFGTTKPLNRFYPMPEHYAAQYWMEVDKRIGEYHQKNLANGFLQPVILKVIGDPNAPSSNPKYANLPDDQKVTVAEEFSDEMSENFSGSERVGRVMTFWATNKDEFPSIEPFPANNQEGYMQALINNCREMITTACKVPGILANINQGATLGGDGNAIRAAVKLMQQRVVKKHHALERIYKNLLSRWYEPVQYEDLSIIHYNPFPELQNVDPQVWEAMTIEERRKWIQDNTEIELSETLPPSELEEQQPDAAQARILNVAYKNYPEKAKQNVMRALKWNEQSQNKCLKKAGMTLSDKIVKGEYLSMKEISRIGRYLSKNEQFKNTPLAESCEAVQYAAWGGSEMLAWCNEKMTEANG